MHKFFKVIVLALTIARFAPAVAQTQQQFDWCNGKGGATRDQIISGCTALIKAGKLQGTNLGAAFRLRGQAFDNQNETDKALADYGRAIALNPNDGDALAARAMLFHANKDDQHALADLATAVRVAPGYATAWAYRGDILYAIDKPTEAIESFAQAIKLSPDWMWPANDRGELYADRGDYELALRDFDQVVRVSPTYAMGWNNRCRVNAILGKLDQALKDCDEALKIAPKFINSMRISGSVTARQHRGFVELKAGKYDQAIEDYNLAVEIVSNAETLYGRGTAKLKKGDTVDGNADIAAAVALDPKIAEKFVSFGVK
jgi:tetratricopeptide (TPR) repeat protein